MKLRWRWDPAILMSGESIARSSPKCYFGNAASYLKIGEAMGKAMLELMEKDHKQ